MMHTKSTAKLDNMTYFNAGDTLKKLVRELVQVVLYKKLARVSVNLVQVSCVQLSTALFQDRNCPTRDTNVIGRRVVVFYASFSCKFMVQVS